MNIYQITSNSDTTEGRGRTLLHNIYFTEKQDALTFIQSKYFADKWGVMGTKGSEYDIKATTLEDETPKVFHTIEDFEQQNSMKISMSVKEAERERLMAMDKEELVEKLMSR